MAFALRSTVTWNTQHPSPDQPIWEDTFEQITGIAPADDPLAEERIIDGRWTYSFVLHSPEGIFTKESVDVIKASGQEWLEELKGLLTPIPKFVILQTKGKSVSPVQRAKVKKQLQQEGLSEAEIAKEFETLQVPEVLEETFRPRTKRLGPTRPSRHRQLKSRIDPITGETLADRPWLDFVVPGDTIPYWQALGLDSYDDKDPVDQVLWRQVYKAWYRTTPKYKFDQKTYNTGKGRGVQSRWGKGIDPETGEIDPEAKGPKTRARYFKSKKGKIARAASATRATYRLKLGLALHSEEFTNKEVQWLQTINDPEIGGTGQVWIDVIEDARERYGMRVQDSDIERIFWEQGLHPKLKTREALENFIQDTYGTPRINPGTGEEYTE